ncbi:hypothetical protein SMICM17S_08073 [Streptomyces microflavus]
MQLLHKVPHALLGVELEHLADLLGQRHAAQEIGDPVRDGERGVEVRRQEAHRSSFHDGTPQYRTLNTDRLVSIGMVSIRPCENLGRSAGAPERRSAGAREQRTRPARQRQQQRGGGTRRASDDSG